jgi:hypothetical protein
MVGDTLGFAISVGTLGTPIWGDGPCAEAGVIDFLLLGTGAGLDRLAGVMREDALAEAFWVFAGSAGDCETGVRLPSEAFDSVFWKRRIS